MVHARSVIVQYSKVRRMRIRLRSWHYKGVVEVGVLTLGGANSDMLCDC